MPVPLISIPTLQTNRVDINEATVKEESAYFELQCRFC